MLDQVCLFFMVEILACILVRQGEVLKYHLVSWLYGELIMALGNGRLNSVGVIKKYNHLLKSKFNLT